MKHNSFSFWFFYKSRLSYPWPDLLPWLMTHVLLLLLAEIMELVICSCWPLLLSGLAASPCPSPEGLLPAPPLTSCSPCRTPPHLSATFYSTFFFLRFCPPPYFCDDKMGLEGPLTGQLVPFCCSKSGSTIIEELLIQHALKILQQWGCRDLQELLLVGTRKKQRRSERGKMSRSLPGEVIETCALPGWPQCMSTWMSLPLLDIMYTSYLLLAASAHPYAFYAHSSKTPLDHLYVHTSEIPSFSDLYSTNTHIWTSTFSLSHILHKYLMRGGEENISLKSDKAFCKQILKTICLFVCFPKWHKDVEF